MTTDHRAAVARLKAAAVQDGEPSNAMNHNDTHGYRVCDSTRYPLFPTAKILALFTSKTAAGADGTDEGKMERMEVDSESKRSSPKPAPDSSDAMEVDVNSKVLSEEEKRETKDTTEDGKTDGASTDNDGTLSDAFVLHDDPRSIWTIEEDLRLLEGIRAHGLGNWVDIAEAVSGQGSTGKTPKRCMERYLDDFMGRYGHILPPVTLLTEENDDDVADKATVSGGGEAKQEETETIRASKRRSAMLRSPSSLSNNTLASRKRFKAVPTESLPGYDKVWPHPYMPHNGGVQVGQEVGREQIYKAEQLYVKIISALETPEQVESVRKEWKDTRVRKLFGPSVLPIRPEDVALMPGAELAGYMPRRGDFDIEWENDAEQAIADMEFLPGEPLQDRELKLKVLAIYNSKLDERESRKRFVLNRHLYDYRKIQTEEQKLPRDERDLVHRMRLFERFHTPDEHKQFIADLLKAKRLRKEIAKLQMYRRLGLTSVDLAEMYELDKQRRSFHKAAQAQKEAEAAKASEAAVSGAQAEASTGAVANETVSSSLWKQYRTTDRKIRKSINRGVSTDVKKDQVEATNSVESLDAKADDSTIAAKAEGTAPMPMDVDDKDETKSQEAVDGNVEFALLPGYSLLSPQEVDLCRKLTLSPSQYQKIKTALIMEALEQGMLDKESGSSTKRSFVKIDVEKRGDVIDFMLQAGWISAKVGQSMKSYGALVAPDVI